MNSHSLKTVCTLGFLAMLGALPASESAPQSHVTKTTAQVQNPTIPAKKSKDLVAAEDKLLAASAKVKMAKIKSDNLRVEWISAKEKAEAASAELKAAMEKTKIANEKAYADAKEAWDRSRAENKEEAAELRARYDRLSSKLHGSQFVELTNDTRARLELLGQKRNEATERYDHIRWSNKPHTEEQKEAVKEEAIAQSASDNLVLQLIAARSKLAAGDAKLLTATIEVAIASDELKGRQNLMTSKAAKVAASSTFLLSDLIKQLASQARTISETVDELLSVAKKMATLETDLAKHEDRSVDHHSWTRVVASGKSKAEVAAALVDLTSNLKDCVSAINNLATTAIPIREDDTDRAEAIVQRASSMSTLSSAKTELEIATSALSTSLTKWNAYEIE